MATIQHSHRSTGRRRRIGPIGTTARLIVGGLLLGSVVQGHLAGPFRPAAWALGPIIFVLCEFQLIDRETEAANELGDASHAKYKERQKKAVIRRLKLGTRSLRDPPRPSRRGK